MVLVWMSGYNVVGGVVEQNATEDKQMGAGAGGGRESGWKLGLLWST